MMIEEVGDMADSDVVLDESELMRIAVVTIRLERSRFSALRQQVGVVIIHLGFRVFGFPYVDVQIEKSKRV